LRLSELALLYLFLLRSPEDDARLALVIALAARRKVLHSTANGLKLRHLKRQFNGAKTRYLYPFLGLQFAYRLTENVGNISSITKINNGLIAT
jgi:hypothetical protein